MNNELADVLLSLSDPKRLREFEADPKAFVDHLDLSAVDKLALLGRHRGVLKYQTRYGDLTEERLRSFAFPSLDMDQEHVQIGPEHEEGESFSTETSIKRTFGPHSCTADIQDRPKEPERPLAKVDEMRNTRTNSLVVVGTGISVGHLTRETMALIQASDYVLYCVADAVTELEIKRLNANCEDLYRYYGDGKLRSQTYREMADRILAVLRDGKNVCAAFYGHPGIFVRPANLVIEDARAEGYEAWMHPAVSSLDCLFADLGIDIAWDGCQIFEATHFVIRDRKPDIESGLLLLQIGSVGDPSFNSKGFDGRHFPILVRKLAESYGWEYEVVLYEASPFSVSKPRVDLMSIAALERRRDNGTITLYVPPVRRAQMNAELSQFFRENAIEHRQSASVTAT
jgi:hypothetical protein